MLRFLLFYKNHLCKPAVLLALSCIVSGCNRENEAFPVPHPGAKNETARQSAERQAQSNSVSEIKTSSAAFVSKQNKKPEAKIKHTVSGTILPENNNPANAIGASGKIRRFETTERDPFALPEELRKQQLSSLERHQTAMQIQQGYPITSAGNRSVYGYGISSESNVITERNGLQDTAGRPRSVPPCSPEPCVAGIFDNGKDKFALVRWQQIRGLFHAGEALGNGYYVKEITADSVILCAEQNSSHSGTLTLTLQ